MPNFSKVPYGLLWRVPHGRINPIQLYFLSPGSLISYNNPVFNITWLSSYLTSGGLLAHSYSSTIDYRRVVIECVAHPFFVAYNDKMPSHMRASLWAPKKYLLDKPGVALDPDSIEVPEPCSPFREVYAHHYDDHLPLYWDRVSGSEFELKLDDSGNWNVDSQQWPGNISKCEINLRKYHGDHELVLRYLFGCGWSWFDDKARDLLKNANFRKQVHALRAGIPLQVSTTLNEPTNRLLLLIKMWKKQRSASIALDLRLEGVVGEVKEGKAFYFPLNIVYCPPGKDMTNSHEETSNHATRITMGYSNENIEGNFQSIKGGISISLFGIVGVDTSYENTSSREQTASHASSAIIRFTNTQGTIITANNQRAIGRAYWGPLSDLFVILENMKMLFIKAFKDEDEDEPIIGAYPLPNSKPCRKLIIPTHLLLDPKDDPIANRIEWVDRKELLLRNPFIRGRDKAEQEANLEKFHAGQIKLEEVVDPYADPNRYNASRALLVTSLGVGAGSEINYYETKQIQVDKVDSEEESYQLRCTQSGSAGGAIVIGGGVTVGDTLTVRYHNTKEMAEEEAWIKTAKCYLIRDQNDHALGDIDVYYDCHFGTFMFRQILNASGERTPTLVAVQGSITDIMGSNIAHEHVTLINTSSSEWTRTATDKNGYYAFPCVEPGDYVLKCGGDEKKLTIKPEDIAKRHIELNLIGAKRILDLQRAKIIDLIDGFDISGSEAIKLGKAAQTLQSEEQVFKFLELSKNEIDEFGRQNVLIPMMKRRAPIPKKRKTGRINRKDRKEP